MIRQEQQFTVNVLKCLCRNVDSALHIFHTERVNAQMMRVERDIFTLLLYSAYSTVPDSCTDLSLFHIQQTADMWRSDA